MTSEETDIWITGNAIQALKCLHDDDAHPRLFIKSPDHRTIAEIRAAAQGDLDGFPAARIKPVLDNLSKAHVLDKHGMKYRLADAITDLVRWARDDAKSEWK